MDTLNSLLKERDEKVGKSVLGKKALFDELVKTHKLILDYSKHYQVPETVKNQINKIYKLKISSNEKARISFKLIIENELLLLPPSSRDKIRNLIKNFKVNDTAAINGAFSYIHKNKFPKLTRSAKEKSKKRKLDQPELDLSVDMPIVFQNTPIDYAIRAHEVFHAIQWEILANTKAFKQSKQKFYFLANRSMDKLKNRQLQEANSIAAEWRYISSLPKSIKSEMLKIISENNTLTHIQKRWVARVILSGRFKNSKAHILNEYKAGRYSSKDLKTTHKLETKKNINEALRNGTIVAVPTLAITHQILEQVCLNQVDEKGNYPQTDFFKKVCLVSPLIGSNIRVHILCTQTRLCSF